MSKELTPSIRVGCSGWRYKHWRGDFYRADLPQSRWLEYYAERFNTVEINNTFYRLPDAATLEATSQMAFPQEHENTKTRNNLKVFFFVLSCFRGFVIVRVYETRSSLLEAKPRGELKCARPAGAERLPHALVRLPERRRDDEVEVEVRQVRGIEDVEHLADQT